MFTWSKQPVPRRGGAPDLARVVETAIEIADTEGLPAVSMRGVATALRSGTASLYRILESRDELLDRMIDAVLGDAEPPLLSGAWRDDLSAVARTRRALLVRHPWLGPELSGRPALGPHALRHHERGLAAVAALTDDPTTASSALEIVLAYVLGAAARETAETQTQRRTGVTEEQWRTTVGPYLRAALGDLPHLRRAVEEARDLDADERFERGLVCVLDGVGAFSRDGGPR